MPDLTWLSVNIPRARFFYSPVSIWEDTKVLQIPHTFDIRARYGSNRIKINDIRTVGPG
jgi:hypothetical protein